MSWWSSAEKERADLLAWLSAAVLYLSHLMTKLTKWHVRPAKTQISLGIRPVWSESSLCAQWVAKDPSFLHADSKDSDQSGRMPRLIWIFAGRTATLLVLSRGSSLDAVLSVCVPFRFRLGNRRIRQRCRIRQRWVVEFDNFASKQPSAFYFDYR